MHILCIWISPRWHRIILPAWAFSVRKIMNKNLFHSSSKLPYKIFVQLPTLHLTFHINECRYLPPSLPADYSQGILRLNVFPVKTQSYPFPILMIKTPFYCVLFTRSYWFIRTACGGSPDPCKNCGSSTTITIHDKNSQYWHPRRYNIMIGNIFTLHIRHICAVFPFYRTQCILHNSMNLIPHTLCCNAP